MSLWRVWASRVCGLVRQRRVDAELDAEIRAHLDLLTAEHRARGLSRAEAERAARRDFGGIELMKDVYRHQQGVPIVETLVQDIRYGLRTLRRTPGFTAIAVLTLASGIGANTTVFSVVDALLLRWLPVRDPQALVTLNRLQGSQQAGTYFTYPQVQELSPHRDMFAGLAGFTTGQTFAVGPPDAVEITGGAWVSGEYYDMLGLRPIAGRLLTPNDDRRDAPPAAVITDAYWSRRFDRNREVVGRPLIIEGVPVTIIGVTPPGFTGASIGQPADVTLALGVLPQLKPEQANMLERGGRWLRILARPQPGVALDRLNAQLGVIWTQLVSDALPPTASEDARRTALASSIRAVPAATGTSTLRSQYQQPVLLLMAVVVCVLLIACANVANLLLARASVRQREIAIRLALGASRGRVIRQLLTEGALLAGTGAVLGIGVALVGGPMFTRMMSSDAVFDLSPNWRLLAFTSVVAVITTLLFGLAPALRATDIAPGVGSSRATQRRGRLGTALVIVQVSISLLLLVGAGLFIRTLWNLRTLDPGFRREGLLLVDVDARRAGYQAPELQTFNENALASVATLPGVRAASLSLVTPLMGGGISLSVAVNGRPVKGTIENSETHVNIIDANYFHTLGTAVLMGREFTPQDDSAALSVAVVNEAFVRRYMAEGNPLAQRVSILGFGPSSTKDAQVVGVVQDAVYERLRDAPPPTVYAPYRQLGGGAVTLEVSTAQMTSVAAEIRDMLRPPAIPPTTRVRVRSLTELLDSGLMQERLMATLAGVFGTLALFLAAAGLYGLLAYTMARRTAEIGVRLVLGARPAHVLRSVIREAFVMILMGATFGLPLAWGLSRLTQSLLFGVEPTDIATSLAAVVLLTVCGLIAAFVPAWRAAHVEPIVALRCE